MVNTQDKHQPLPPSSLAVQQKTNVSSGGGKQNENIFKNNDEDFFELLTRSQSKRMDDQRCTLKLTHAESVDSARKPLTQHNSNATATAATTVVKENRNALLEMIADFQSERMDEQRALLPGLKRISLTNSTANRPNVSSTSATADPVDGVQIPDQQPAAAADQQAQQDGGLGGGVVGTPPDDAFLDMLMRCQGSRIEEQRSELPTPNITMDVEAGDRRAAGNSNSGATVPDEDFFSLIMRLQGGRMEDQRATVPLNNNVSSNNNNRSNINNNNVNNSVSSSSGSSTTNGTANHPNGNGNNQNQNVSGNAGKGLK